MCVCVFVVLSVRGLSRKIIRFISIKDQEVPRRPSLAPQHFSQGEEREKPKSLFGGNSAAYGPIYIE